MEGEGSQDWDVGIILKNMHICSKYCIIVISMFIAFFKEMGFQMPFMEFEKVVIKYFKFECLHSFVSFIYSTI